MANNISKASNSANISRKQNALHQNNMHHSMMIAGGPTTPNFQKKEAETLYDEAIKMKQLANKHKEENIKLKTRIKILENDNARKEKLLEDFYQQSQFIQNSQKNSGLTGNLAPIVQTA